MMNIIVTGANGQLGNQLKQLSSGYPGFNFIFTDLPEVDITSEHAVNEILLSTQPAWLINCAAYTAVDKAETESELAQKINADGPALLARLTDQHHVRMIHISTDYVFDGMHYKPYKEDHKKNPQGIYAETKSLGEDLVLANNPRSIIFRTSWLYSIYGQNFVKTVIRYSQEKGKMRVVADQIGTPTWAGDLSNAIMNAIEVNLSPGVYHYSDEGVCSWYDFSMAIIELQNINAIIEPITTSEFGAPAPRPSYSVLDKSLFKRETGLKIPYWRDSLKVCLKQLNEQG